MFALNYEFPALFCPAHIFRKVSILLFVFMFTCTLYSQTSEKVCGTKPVLIARGPQFPVSSTDTIKALVIFVRYLDDNFWCCDGWPTDVWSVPKWGYQVLSSKDASVLSNPSISGYFDAMSSYNIDHGWQFRGDEYRGLYVTQHPIFYYQNNGGLGAVSEEVFTSLDSKINFADYDKLDPLDMDHDGNYNEPDGYADMIILWFRWLNSGIDGSTFSGIATLGGLSMSFPHGIFTSNDIVNVNGTPTHVRITPYTPGDYAIPACGLMGEGTSLNDIDIFVHEVGHYLFGLSHTPHLGLWNLMTGNGVGIMNALERSQLGWIPDPPHYQSQYGTYNIRLKDFETTGEAYIFDAYAERYVLENRWTDGFYSRAGDWKMPGNGLLFTNLHFFPENGDLPYTIACADNKWIWSNLGTGNCGALYCLNLHNMKFIYPFQKVEPSNTGFSFMEMHDICTFDGTENMCRSVDSSFGKAGNLWNIGYNQVFSPWSNPKTGGALNGKGIIFDIQRQNEDGSFDILVKFGVDNCEAGTHPSKPMWLRASKYYFDLERPHRFHPKLEWLFNTEPDVIGNHGYYKIFRGMIKNYVDPVYVLIDSVQSSQNTYIDEKISLYDGGDSYGCAYKDRVYAYRISAVDNENLESVRSDRAVIKGYIDPCETQGDNPAEINNNGTQREFSIFNYPNPFNPITEIRFTIPSDLFVTIRIYNTLGQVIETLIGNEYKKAGSYSVTFDGTNLASGIYFYYITAGDYHASKKMLLIK
jgi:hypothetical protein